MIRRRMPENKKRPARTSSRPKPATRFPKKPSTADKRTLAAPPAKTVPRPRIARAVVAQTEPPATPPAPKPAPKATGTPLSILMVASEAHPYAKTGGLAEVAAALPDALARL